MPLPGTETEGGWYLVGGIIKQNTIIAPHPKLTFLVEADIY